MPRLIDVINANSQRTSEAGKITLGKVVDTNDPQQMGRVRALCPSFGDSDDMPIETLEWCMYVSPFGGVVSYGQRGHTKDEIAGPTHYGMWSIPKVGSYVLVCYLDDAIKSDGSCEPGVQRVYFGCIQGQYLAHTMPHGRYRWTDGIANGVDGPFDTSENPIQPLYDKTHEQFDSSKGSKGTSAVGQPMGGYDATTPVSNMEHFTRRVDTQVSAYVTEQISPDEDDNNGSEYNDHEFADFDLTTKDQLDGNKRTVKGPGYGLDQHNPDKTYESTTVNYDSMVYSWTTPGFHSISMDDRHENSRIRLRTIAGHQIIMDDTNERIYINTSGGETWMELDNVGNIDIYATKNISTRAKGDINFTTDQTFRVHATKGIHMYSHDDIRHHCKKDYNVFTEQKYRSHSNLETRIESDDHMHLKSTQQKDLYIDFPANININSGQETRLTQGTELHIETSDFGTWECGGVMHHKSSGMLIESSVEISEWLHVLDYIECMTTLHVMNIEALIIRSNLYLSILPKILPAPPVLPPIVIPTPFIDPTPADPAERAEEFEAYWTTRVPDHEPWGRIFMDKDGEGRTDNNGPLNEPQIKPFKNGHILELHYNDPAVGRGGRGDTYPRNPLWHR